MVNKKNPAPNKHFIDPGDSYSAHKMNSEGDVKTCLTPENFDHFLDHYENNVLLNQASNEIDQETVTFKEFAKFMKPKVSFMKTFDFFNDLTVLGTVIDQVTTRKVIKAPDEVEFG